MNTTEKLKPYKVNGYPMVKNEFTWDMERLSFQVDILVYSRITDIDSIEDIEFFEGEIANQLGYDWFELQALQPN
jgi:hypothetical protein